MKTENIIFLFVVILLVLLGDFVSLRILIPKMISSQNDILVWGGFLWGIVLFAIHVLLVVIRKKEVKNG